MRDGVDRDDSLGGNAGAWSPHHGTITARAVSVTCRPNPSVLFHCVWRVQPSPNPLCFAPSWRGRYHAQSMPAPPAQFQFRSAFTDTPAVRRQRLESLAEIYVTALDELRQRRDPMHAELIVHLETLGGQ
jgi:hypothetical protein